MIRRVYDKLNALFIAANIAGTSVIWKIDSGNDESFMITMPSVVHLSSLRDAVSGQVLKDKMAIASSGTQLMTYYGVQMVTMNRIIPVWRKKILWQLVDPYYFKGSLKLNYFRFLFSYRLKKSREVIDEAVLLDTSWSGNYFHWMYDVLCRVFMFSDTSKNKEVVLLTGSRLSNFQKDSLDYLGLSNRVKVLKNNASVNTLYGHSYMMSDNIFDRDLLQKFRQFALSKLQPVIKKFETRIFIMRKNHNTRSFDSPDSLIMELFNHNIKGYYLEDLSFHDQVALFNQVDLVIAPHGAGLSNILFCHEKVKIIELMPENDIRLTYYKLASTLCLDYSCCKIKVNLNNQFEAQNIIENLPALMQTNQ